MLLFQPLLVSASMPALKDPLVQRSLFLASFSFAGWLFCTVFSSHHSGIVETVAISNSSPLFYTLSRYIIG